MDDADDRLLMTPGPTEVPAAVRERMAGPTLNPDVDPAFGEFYRSLRGKVADVYGTERDVVILGGEGILGLEAAIASLVEEGDDVLCISNGIYGDGFADFVEMYGGRPTTVGADYTDPLDVAGVKEAVEGTDFVAATMVHCETPTGVLNDLKPILGVLDDAGIVSVVDAVSSLGGTPVPADDIDVCIGGSQKAFSSPPGLTTLSVSERAWDAVEETPERSFYTSLAPWRDADAAELLPYTHLTANLAALDASVELILEEGIENVFERHREVAAQCRDRADEMGIEVYPDEDLSSPTVTALHVEGEAKALQERIREEHGVVLATGLGDGAEDVLRIGHMGFNAHSGKVERTMDALGAVLR